MRSVCLLTLCVAVLAALAGCVSMSKYRPLLAENEKQKDKLDELGLRVDQTRLTAANLRSQLKAEQDAVGGLQRGESARDQQIALLRNRAQALEAQLRSLREKPAPTVAAASGRPAEPEAVVLPPAVVDALKNLADEEPGLEFHSRLGRCRFTSDVLFEKGSAVVRPEFTRVLGKFGAILSGVGKGLHLRIEGHTDSQRIRNVGTRAAHPTNWHLSAHRAIEVLRALYKAGIEEDRVRVVGHGSHRPIADNGTAAGRARNRRVEIFVVGPAPAAASG